MMKKKLTAVLMTAVLLLGIMTLPAMAEEESDAGNTTETIAAEAEETPEPTDTPEATPEPTATPAPTAAPTPTAAPVAPTTAVRLTIDGENVYEGMEIAYKDGYVPTVADGVVTLVLPLLASGDIQGNQITVTPDLGDTSATPIQYKNYQKVFPLAENIVNDTGEENQIQETVVSYLVYFEFPLKSDYDAGVYPITLEVEATDTNGNLIQQSFTCYVTIAETVDTNASSDINVTNNGSTVSVVSGGYSSVAEEPESSPRILVSKYTVDASPVAAGDDFTLTVTLWNTSKTQNLQNILITVSCDSSNMVLKNDSNSIYIDALEAGGTVDIELKYGTDVETPAQRYTVSLNMEYDNSDAVTMSSNGIAVVEVVQVPVVELSDFRLDSSLNAGETVQLSFQVMNLGRCAIYNARIELDVPGMSPMSTAFIGTMQAGTDANASMNVFVTMKDGETAEDRYGFTYGDVRLIYEDVNGTEYTQEIAVSTTINELVISSSAATEDEEETSAAQWWIAVAAGAVVIVVLVVLGLHKRRRG